MPERQNKMFDIVSLADFGCIADCIDGMTGTDNTANMQAAINATPSGGALYIPGNLPTAFGSTGEGDAPGYGFSSTLVVDHPINVFGRGMFSRVVPLSGFNPAMPNFHVQENAHYWAGIKWSSFQMGTSWFQPPYTRNGGEGIFVDGISIPKMFWEELMIGESGNGASLRITGLGTQHHIIDKCTIHGRIHLDRVADGHSITRCHIGGRSVKSGVLVNMIGASVKIIGNHSITAVGGVVIQNGAMPVISDNYFEELPGYPINNYNNGGGYNGLVTLVGYPGQVNNARIRNNILNLGVSGSGNGFNVPGATAYCININPAVGGVVNTIIDGNEFNLSSNRGFINSLDPHLLLGPNTLAAPASQVGWSRMSPGSMPPVQIYGGG